MSGAVPPLARPKPPGPARETLVFAWRALLKIKHTPEQLFDVAITPVMFTVLFTYMFGGAIAGSPERYLHFLLPGIIVQTVMFSSVYTGVTLNQDIGKGVYDRFRSLPIWPAAPLAGAILGDVLRYCATAAIVFAVGALMGWRPEGGLLAVAASVALLVAFAIGVGWIFIALALVVRSVGTVMTLSWLVLMPLTFASNVYVEPATLPGWLQAFVAVNPVTHVVTALRGLLAGAPDAGAIALALLAPAAVCALFSPIALRLYRRER